MFERLPLAHALATQVCRALPILPLAGCGFAWFGRFVVERNRPATFVHPLRSPPNGGRMFFLWISGRTGSAARPPQA